MTLAKEKFTTVFSLIISGHLNYNEIKNIS